jgi:hypothetical protein
MYIASYKKFEQNQPMFLLPAHSDEGNANIPDRSIIKMSDLVNLYPEPHKLGNKINSYCENGIYMLIKEVNTGLDLISYQEPMIIFGVEKGREITIGPYNGLRVDVDSIIVFVKSDESIYFLSLEDDYIFTFIKPNIRISNIDPYGEEDWS